MLVRSNSVYNTVLFVQQIYKYTKSIFFRDNYISNIYKNIYIKTIDTNSEDKLDTEIIKNN